MFQINIIGRRFAVDRHSAIGWHILITTTCVYIDSPFVAYFKSFPVTNEPIVIKSFPLMPKKAPSFYWLHTQLMVNYLTWTPLLFIIKKQI